MRVSKFGIYAMAVGLLAVAIGCADSAPFPRAYDPADPAIDPGAGRASGNGNGDNDSPGSDPFDLAGGPKIGGGPNAPHLLEITGVTPVRLTPSGDEVALEPHEALMTVTVVQLGLDGKRDDHTPLRDSRITVPFNAGAVGFGLGQQVEIQLRLDASEYDVQCTLVFDLNGYVSGAARVDEGEGFEFGELLCPDEVDDVGIVIGFRVEEDPRPPDPVIEAEFVCDGAPLPVSGRSALGSISCPHFDTDDSPTFEVRVWAEPLGPIGANTEFNVQARLINPEPIVNAYRDFLGVAVLADAYIELAQLDGSNPITLAVDGPCELDYTGNGGAPAPVTMTTAVETVQWSATNESITVEATDMAFFLGSPGVTASTKPVPSPACEWLQAPRLTFGANEVL
ncbi:MAG: hypothetical protein WBG86_05325 [Polyangiales bacterium]